MDATFLEVIKQVQRLTQSIQAINHILKEDELIFKENDVIKIDASNDKKNQLLATLQSAQQNLQQLLVDERSNQPLTLTAWVEAHPANKAKAGTKAVDELKLALMNGYQHLITNNQVIIGNLSFIKEFWDKLAQLSQKQQGIYDKPSVR